MKPREMLIISGVCWFAIGTVVAGFCATYGHSTLAWVTGIVGVCVGLIAIVDSFRKRPALFNLQDAMPPANAIECKQCGHLMSAVKETANHSVTCVRCGIVQPIPEPDVAPGGISIGGWGLIITTFAVTVFLLGFTSWSQTFAIKVITSIEPQASIMASIQHARLFLMAAMVMPSLLAALLGFAALTNQKGLGALNFVVGIGLAILVVLAPPNPPPVKFECPMDKSNPYVTEANFAKIHLGMSDKEILRILGDPMFEFLKEGNGNLGWHSGPHEQITVSFECNAVTSASYSCMESVHESRNPKVNKENEANIKIDMTKQEVESLLGAPDPGYGIRLDGSRDYCWRNSKKYLIGVTFKDGRVSTKPIAFDLAELRKDVDEAVKEVLKKQGH